MQTFLMVVLAIASIILIGSILMQSSNSAGLSVLSVVAQSSCSVRKKAEDTKVF